MHTVICTGHIVTPNQYGGGEDIHSWPMCRRHDLTTYFGQAEQQPHSQDSCLQEDRNTVLWDAAFDNSDIIRNAGGLFWVHFPKASTSFGRTLFTWACRSGPSAGKFTNVTTNKPPNNKGGGDCDGRLSALQAGLSGEWYHMSIPVVTQGPSRSVHWEYTHKSKKHTVSSTDAKVGAVALFRQPGERFLSGFNHMYRQRYAKNVVGAGDWGWTARIRRNAVWAATNATNCDTALLGTRCPTEKERYAVGLQEYASGLKREQAMYSCQTKMLMGKGCHEPTALSAAKAEEARRKVMTVMHFLGFRTII